MHADAMIASHPQMRGQSKGEFVHCIEICFDCAQACIACADACLAEDDLSELRTCIRRNLDCADICAATGAIASRSSGSNEAAVRFVLQACAELCKLCGDECESHAARHEHCKICASVCKACEKACRDVMPGTH
jgi:hypothetical protein